MMIATFAMRVLDLEATIVSFKVGARSQGITIGMIFELEH